MVNTIIVIVALLICQTFTATPNSNQIICSAFCAPQIPCTGFSSTDCKSCNPNGWGGSPACDITNPAYALLDYSGDAGGSITVTPGATTTNCPTLLTYTTAYGDFRASDTVTINLVGGTYLGHYAVDLYFDILLIDTNGGQKWQNSPKMTSTLVGTTLTGTKTFNNPITTWKEYCGDTNKDDKHYMFYSSYTHNLTNVDISFTITTDNNPTNAIWVAKEFIYVLRLCHIACLTCNGSSNINMCFSCDSSLNYTLNNNSCLTSCTTGYGNTSDPSVCIWCNLKCKACF